MTVIPAFRRWEQKDHHEFKASLGLSKTQKKKKSEFGKSGLPKLCLYC